MGDAAEAELSNVIQGLRPEHLRVIALRLDGKRWSEIAAALGVTPWTVWHWRQECPEIDEIIASESQDFLESSKHALAKLVPIAVKTLREEMEKPTEYVGSTRVSAAKYVLDRFAKTGAQNDPPATPRRKLEAWTSDELSAALDEATRTESG